MTTVFAQRLGMIADNFAGERVDDPLAIPIVSSVDALEPMNDAASRYVERVAQAKLEGPRLAERATTNPHVHGLSLPPIKGH